MNGGENVGGQHIEGVADMTDAMSVIAETQRLWAAGAAEQRRVAQERQEAGMARAAELAEWMRRRCTAPDPARRLQIACEHEAAHAIVGHEAGLTIHDVTANSSGGGGVEYAPGGDVRAVAALLAAPTVWVTTMRCEEFPEGDERGGAADREKLLRLCNFDDRAIQDAFQVARNLLREHADEVLDLAAALACERFVAFAEWKARSVRSRRTESTSRARWEWEQQRSGSWPR